MAKRKVSAMAMRETGTIQNWSVDSWVCENHCCTHASQNELEGWIGCRPAPFFDIHPEYTGEKREW
jgi:hypothetical protein